MSEHTETLREVAAEIVHEFDDDGRIVGAGVQRFATLLGKVKIALAGLHPHADKHEIADTVMDAVAQHESDVKVEAAAVKADDRQVGVGGAAYNLANQRAPEAQHGTWNPDPAGSPGEQRAAAASEDARMEAANEARVRQIEEDERARQRGDHIPPAA